MRFLFCLVLLLLGENSIFCQTELLTKKGGVVFRVDDNQPINNWKDYRDLFNKYNFNFSAAINVTGIMGNSEYINLLKLLQNEGHEIMDHSPDHVLHYFRKVANKSDYLNRKGVDHINGDKVCLSYEYVDTTTQTGEGLIDISGDKVISQNNGEFNDLKNIYSIYISMAKSLFCFNNVLNKNSSDPDTISIQSFWGEPINFGSLKGLSYHKIGPNDIRMIPEAIDILAERTQDILKQNNINLPKTFIHPGVQLTGALFNFTNKDIKEHFSKYGIIASAIYEKGALKCFNEYNFEGLNQYSLQWGDLQEDINSFEYLKKIIADRNARHYYSVGHSHFINLLGGWSGYLARMDSLLSWCKQKNIQVVTYSEMAKKLYYDKPNPYENIFPKLDIDFDEDGFPDGYQAGFGVYEKNDGVIQSSNNCFSRNSAGTISSINLLAGIEKGENDFVIYTKGAIGDSIRVIFQLEGKANASKTFVFPANTENWQRYSLSSMNKSYFIPDSINTLNVIIATQSYKSGIVKISGMELRRKSPYTILPSWIKQSKIIQNKIELYWINNEKGQNYNVILQKKDQLNTNYIDVAIGGVDFDNYIDSSIIIGNNYTYRIKNINSNNEVAFSDSINIFYTYTLIDNENNISNMYSLSQNYPNPFNSTTNISYKILSASEVNLRIFDILGSEVKTLLNEYQNAGSYNYKVSLDNLKFSSGVYFYRLQAGNFIQTKKMLLIK